MRFPLRGCRCWCSCKHSAVNVHSLRASQKLHLSASNKLVACELAAVNGIQVPSYGSENVLHNITDVTMSRRRRRVPRLDSMKKRSALFFMLYCGANIFVIIVIVRFLSIRSTPERSDYKMPLQILKNFGSDFLRRTH